MDINDLLVRWSNEPSIFRNLCSWKCFHAQEPKYSSFPPTIHPSIINALRNKGIHQLYQHQSDAINFALKGYNVLINTGTASGKSLCYNALILNIFMLDEHATALYIFPTKALAHDQAVKLQYFLNEIISDSDTTSKNQSHLIGIYDGDTPYNLRKTIREKSRLIFTNPDMLHTSILPHHTQWYKFFSGLRYIVIDEIHTYRGVFGSHIANVVRRLKRIASHYGSNPKYILTSGTLSNPLEFAKHLIGEDVSIIDNDCAPKGTKHVIIYNPPLVNADFGIRLHPSVEAKRLASDLFHSNIQTLIFCQSRKAVENLLIDIRKDIESVEPSKLNAIYGYRSGYLPEQRRKIEKDFRSGLIRTIISTNALELGIDIGELDAVILNGYPGTISSTWQQIGRGGRKGRMSIGILILSASPLDQYLARNPQYFWDRSPEQALINPDNPLILYHHLKCALNEIPLKGPHFENADPALVEALLDAIVISAEAIKNSKGEYFFSGTNSPHSFSLRTNSHKQINLLIETNNHQKVLLGEVDEASADWLVHPGAIYLHQGDIFLVSELDIENNKAILTPTEAEYYTNPIMDTQITQFTIKETLSKPNHQNEYFQSIFADIKLTFQLIGYSKVDWNTNQIIEKISYSLPPKELVTNAFAISLNDTLINELRLERLWSNDPNYYGADWNELKLLIRKRDEYRCRVCGISENDTPHDVHHITPFRNFSSVNEANQLSNLITVCKKCHKLIEQAVRVQSGLAAFGYAIRHIAPLFAMCDHRDIGVHIDPKFKFLQNRASILVYENISGGVGISKHIYDIAPDLLSSIYEHIANCSCLDGCPSCTGPTPEGGRSGKKEALAILKSLVRYG